MLKIVKITVFIFVAVSASANAEVIVFDNGGPDYSMVGGADLLLYIQAEDFTVAQNEIITGAHFFTIEQHGPSWDETLEYFIFDNDGGKPGNLLHSGDGQQINRSYIKETNFAASAFEYDFKFENQLNVTAGQVYWFGLHLNPLEGSVIRWDTTSSGLGSTDYESLGGTQDNWQDTSYHHAFYLTPEPASIALLGLGLLFIRKRIA